MQLPIPSSVTLGRGTRQRMDKPKCWERNKSFTLSASSVLDSG